MANRAHIDLQRRCAYIVNLRPCLQCIVHCRPRFDSQLMQCFFFGKNEECAVYACLSIVRFGFTIIVTIVEFLWVQTIEYIFQQKRRIKFTSKLVFTFILEVTILEIPGVIVLGYNVFVRTTLLFSEGLSWKLRQL